MPAITVFLFAGAHANGFFYPKGLYMAKQVQLRRGTAAQNNQFTGAPGEVTVDTDLNTLRVHDGTTPGGTILATMDSVTTGTGSPISAAYISNISRLSNSVTNISLDPDTKWTSTKDGHIFIYGTSSSSGQGLWLALQNSQNATMGYDDAFSSDANQRLTVNMPVAAGQAIFYSVSSGVSGVTVNFVPTNGNV